MAELVILARAVTATTSKAENLARTVSTPFPRADISTFLAAELTFSKPFDASENFNFCLSLSRVDIVV